MRGIRLFAALALTCSWTARSEDVWAFERELLTHPAQDGQQAFLYTHQIPTQQDYGLPGISFKSARRAALKAVSVLMQGDASDISTHYFSVYVNTVENFRTNALMGQSFLFDPAVESSFKVEAYEPDGLPTDYLLVTLTFPQSVELAGGQAWMISPVIELASPLDNGFFLPSMVASYSTALWEQGGLLGPKVDEYVTQTITPESGTVVTETTSVQLTSQFAADLLISTTPRQQGDGSPRLALAANVEGLQLSWGSPGWNLFATADFVTWTQVDLSTNATAYTCPSGGIGSFYQLRAP